VLQQLTNEADELLQPVGHWLTLTISTWPWLYPPTTDSLYHTPSDTAYGRSHRRCISSPQFQPIESPFNIEHDAIRVTANANRTIVWITGQGTRSCQETNILTVETLDSITWEVKTLQCSDGGAALALANIAGTAWGVSDGSYIPTRTSTHGESTGVGTAALVLTGSDPETRVMANIITPGHETTNPLTGEN